MNARPYITCRELIDFLFEFLDGTMDESQAAEFRRHLAVCASCRAYLASYEATIRVGKEAMRYDDSPDEEAPEDLIRAILNVRGR